MDLPFELKTFRVRISANMIQLAKQLGRRKKGIKQIYTRKQRTSKKIPHLDDVVCHAVQTETLTWKPPKAPKASQCKGGIVEQ